MDDLVRAHLAIVGYQVSETLARLPGHVLRDDLVSAGMAALAQSAVSYEPATGVPFARYATLRIRGAILDELRSMDWAPRGARARSRQLTSAEETLSLQLGRKPDRHELAAALGCAPEDVDAARATTERALISMDAYDGIVADILPHSGPGPEEQLLQNEQVHYLRAAINALPARLRTVVEALFIHDRPSSDIAAELGVTESRISQLRTEALGMMRDGMNAALEPTLVPAAERPGGVVDRRRQAYIASVAAHAAAAPMVGTSLAADKLIAEEAAAAAASAAAARRDGGGGDSRGTFAALA